MAAVPADIRIAADDGKPAEDGIAVSTARCGIFHLNEVRYVHTCYSTYGTVFTLFENHIEISQGAETLGSPIEV